MAGAAEAEAEGCQLESGGSTECSSSCGGEVRAEAPAEAHSRPAGEAAASEASGSLDGPALTCLLGPKQRQRALLQKQRQKREHRDAIAHWVQRWREYTALHPEIVGAERDEMKAAFDEMQLGEMHAETLCRIPKAHFAAVMSDLRRSRHARDREIGTWRGYTPMRVEEGKPRGRRRPRNRRRGGGAGGSEAAPSEADAGDAAAVSVAVGPGLLGGLGARAAAELGRDLYILQTKFNINLEVRWAESRLDLDGARDPVATAREELSAILDHYFPGEAVLDAPAEGGAAPRHWADVVKCSLTEAQKAKVLAQTQDERERQRNAVLHWADRWEAYVRQSPELVQSTRALMKDGFERMMAAELSPETPGKVHFGLVMNFLRQSGRRHIAVWRDYCPKGWKG